jgi:hypothetical protein
MPSAIAAPSADPALEIRVLDPVENGARRFRALRRAVAQFLARKMGRGVQGVVPDGNGAIVFFDAPISQVVIAHPYDMGRLMHVSSRAALRGLAWVPEFDPAYRLSAIDRLAFNSIFRAIRVVIVDSHN